MNIFLPALVSISCLALISATARAALPDREDENGLYSLVLSDYPLLPAMSDQVAEDQPPALSSLYEHAYAGKKSLHDAIPQREALGFYVDVKRLNVSGTLDQRSLLADNEPLRLASWLEGSNVNDHSFMLGYRWKRLSIEGATLQPARRTAEDTTRQQGSAIRSNWRSTRLSFSPAENWQIKLSRGAVSNLDNLVPGEQVRRTALAATYSVPFSGGGWEATVAWGRNARKNRESHSGYLLESTLRFAGVHAMFGRIEQVGSDSLMRENEALQRQLFNLNRVTIGYYQDLRINGPIGLDVGAFVSRHLVPSEMTPSYGKDPTAYMLFIRLKMQ